MPYLGYDRAGRDLRAINLTRLRFACQVLILDAAGKLTLPLGPVETTRVTHYPDKLKILEASHDRGSARGGLQVLLFTAKVNIYMICGLGNPVLYLILDPPLGTGPVPMSSSNESVSRPPVLLGVRDSFITEAASCVPTKSRHPRHPRHPLSATT